MQLWQRLKRLSRNLARKQAVDADLDAEIRSYEQMLIDEIRKAIPEARIRYVDQLDDPRNYRVNCDLIQRELGFKVTRRVPDGIREVMEVVRLGIVSDPDDQRYYNIPHKRAQ